MITFDPDVDPEELYAIYMDQECWSVEEAASLLLDVKPGTFERFSKEGAGILGAAAYEALHDHQKQDTKEVIERANNFEFIKHIILDAIGVNKLKSLQNEKVCLSPATVLQWAKEKSTIKIPEGFTYITGLPSYQSTALSKEIERLQMELAERDTEIKNLHEQEKELRRNATGQGKLILKQHIQILNAALYELRRLADPEHKIAATTVAEEVNNHRSFHGFKDEHPEDEPRLSTLLNHIRTAFSGPEDTTE